MGSSVPNSPKMLARLWAARPQRLPAALSVLVLIISLYLDISGPALWLTVAIIKRVASLVAFVALFAGTFTGLVVSKVNITRILENSRNWEALKGQESLRTARAVPDSTPRPEFVTPSSPAGLDLDPADILFQNWSVPYEISAEFGEWPISLCARLLNLACPLRIVCGLARLYLLALFHCTV